MSINNRQLYSWNPVFNKVMEIKDTYVKLFGHTDYNCKSGTFIENWIQKINNADYTRLFAPVQFSQNKTSILFRYGSYSDIFKGETQIDTLADFWESYDGFYTECRSVVIDVEKEIIVIAPFKKFHNLNETEYNSIDNVKKRIAQATCVEVSEKIDGSMQCASYDVNTQQIIYTGAQAISEKHSWRITDGKKRLLEQPAYVNMIQDNPDLTFIFEYIALADAHVVIYTKEQEGLYLIGIRNNKTGEQLSYREVCELADKHSNNYGGVRTTNVLSCDKYNLDHILKTCEIATSDKMEGFVLNIDGNLIKIKADDYVKVHKVLSAISSPNLVLRSIVDNTYDDLLSKVPTVYRSRVENDSRVVFDYLFLHSQVVAYYYYKCRDVCVTNGVLDKRQLGMCIKSVPKIVKSGVMNWFLKKEKHPLIKNDRGDVGYYNYTQITNRLEQLKKIKESEGI